MKKWLVLGLLAFLTVTTFAQSAGPTYYYVVTAIDAGGFESTFSNEVAAPFTQGKHIANLTWVAPTGTDIAVSYNVYRGTVKGGPYAKINASAVTGVTYLDSFLLPNAPSGLAATLQ